MKKFLFLNVLILSILISTNGISQYVTVSGQALLNGNSNHSGIIVIFDRIAPDISTDTAYTDFSGSYSKEILSGIYNIIFIKSNYFTQTLREQIIYSNKTLNTITLTSSGLSGKISGNLVKSDYVISDSLWVEKGDTLTIEAGTRLFFKKNTGLYIHGGCLKAIGTEQDSIIFTRQLLTDDNPDSTFWKGISIIDTRADSSSKLKYCHISFTNKNAIRIDCSSPLVENNLISNCYGAGGGLLVDEDGCICKPVIRNIRFINGGLLDSTNVYPESFYCHVYFVASNRITIENIEITGIKSSLLAAIGFFDSPQVQKTHITINNLFIHDNAGKVIMASNSEVIFNNFTSVNNHRFINNFGRKIIINNSIISNHATLGSTNENNIRITNTCLFNNDSNSILGKWIGLNVTTNKRGDSCDAYGNITLNPQFVSDSSGDFNLLPSSPCIDAGVNDSVTCNYDIENHKRIWDGNMDGDSVVDMGCYEYGAPPLNHILIDEDFERGFTTWKIIKNEDESPKWIFYSDPAIAHSGKFSLKLEGNTSISNSSIYTDYIKLPLVDVIKLNFWLKYSLKQIIDKRREEINFSDRSFSIHINKFGDDKIVQVFDVGNISDNWAEFSAELKKYAGENVRFILTGMINVGKDLFLDDIKLHVSNNPLYVDENRAYYIENVNFIISPNPAGEYIEITGIVVNPRFKSWVQSNSEIRIYDVLGEVVQSGTHPFIPSQEGKIRIDVSGLVEGVYFVRIGEWTGSFVKI